jgi:DNA-binding SARP family transcriptional activator
VKKPDTTFEIQTLGSFSITVLGKPVATDWPDETMRALFCSLFSPLNRYFSWDRICRSMWGASATQSTRRRLEKILSGPLNAFLIDELGFNPLITGSEGIKIDYQHIHVDAFEFHCIAVEGLKLLSAGDHSAAFEKLSKAKSLYRGSYLPDIKSKIIANTRTGLDSLYRTSVLEAMPLARNSNCSGLYRRAKSGLHLKAVRKQFQTMDKVNFVTP